MAGLIRTLMGAALTILLSMALSGGAQSAVTPGQTTPMGDLQPQHAHGSTLVERRTGRDRHSNIGSMSFQK